MAEPSATTTLERVAYGPHRTANNPDGLQSPDQNPIPNMVRDLLVRAREVRRPLIAQWRQNYFDLHNRGWRPDSNPWDERPAISQIWPVIASSVSWMTDQRPSFDLNPTAEAFGEYWDFYDQLAQDMNQVLQSAFLNYSIDGEINKVLWDAYTYGIGYFKTQWEAHLADGLGDSVPRRVDPYTIYPDPYAHDMEDLTYIIELHNMTIDDADRAWPGAADLIRGAYHVEEAEEAPTRLEGGTTSSSSRPPLPGQMKAPSGTGYRGETLPAHPTGFHARTRSQRANKITETPVITVLECYVRGYKVEKVDDGVAKVRDNWRCIVTTGNIVLVDRPCGGPEGVNGHGTQPYSRFVLFDSGEWYGPSLVELLAPLQRLINSILGSIVRNLFLMGNPQIVESPRSASRNKRIRNGPGQRVEAEPDNYRWLQPPQIHSTFAIDVVGFLKSEIEHLSGLSAMTQGFSPTGRNAQSVLDSVQDAAFVRVRNSLRELERTLRDVGNKMVANIAEFYTEQRLMSIIGEDGQRTRLALNSRHFYAIDSEDPSQIIPLRFSLAVDAGSSLPTSKQARAAEAKHLFELGAIDEIELLKALGWPAWANVVQRVMQAKAGAAQQAAVVAGRTQGG